MKHIALKMRRLATTSAFVISIITAQFAGMSFAHAVGATDTWTGTGGDTKFSTAANWSGSVLPVSGDIINFLPAATGSNYQSIYLTNDLSGVAFGGVIQGSASSGFYTYYDINTINFSAGASITQDKTGTKQAYVEFQKSGSPSTGTVNAAGGLNIGTGVQIYGTVMNITGNVTGLGTIYPAVGSSITGGITVLAALIPTGVTVGGAITLLDNTQGFSFANAGGTIANNITTGTFDSTTNLNQLAFGYCTTNVAGSAGGGGGPAYTAIICRTYGNATYTLTGTLTLNANLLIDVAQNSTVNINGTVNYNGHTITMTQDSLGALNVGSTAIATPTLTTPLSDSQPSADYTVQNKENATLDGARQNVTVSSGGTLFGNGTALAISVLGGGIIAPGHSPGKLTATFSLYLGPGSTYQAQLQTSAAGGYDQIVVGTAADTTTDVTIDPAAILSTSLYTGYNIKQGDQFMIINDLGQAAIGGTFAGLSEGTQFKVGGITFNITYKGGTGNDVVLTALNAAKDPGAPNTGVHILKLANPGLLIGLGVATTAVLFALARRRLNR